MENPGQGLDQGRSIWLAGATMVALVVILFVYLGSQVFGVTSSLCREQLPSCAMAETGTITPPLTKTTCPNFNHDRDNCQDDNHEANSDAYLDMD